MAIKILSPKPSIRFRCAHCKAVFETDKWNRTRRGYSASCPCCPYQAWMPR